MNGLINYPKISVVTVVLNNQTQIEATIQSVINQTYSNIEYIIIDGGSTDGTLDIIDKYKNSISVIVSEPDKGLYDAMNKGTDKATGEWIIYMNSGDRFYNSDVLTDIFKNDYEKVKQADVLYSDSIAEYKTRSIRKRPRKIKWIWIRNLAVHQSVFIKTDIAREKKFEMKFEIAADYDVIYYAFQKGAVFKYMEDVCVSICNADEGLSKTANIFKIVYQGSIVSMRYSNIFKKILIVIVNTFTYFYAVIIRNVRSKYYFLLLF
jgi:glycosyltransferase involved in cell wall biosynthesis